MRSQRHVPDAWKWIELWMVPILKGTCEKIRPIMLMKEVSHKKL